MSFGSVPGPTGIPTKVTFTPYTDAMGQPVNQEFTRIPFPDTGGKAKVGISGASSSKPVGGSSRVRQSSTTPTAVWPPEVIARVLKTPQFASQPIGPSVVRSENSTKAALSAGGASGGVAYKSAMYAAPGGVACWSVALTGAGEVVAGVGSGYTDVTAEPGVDTNEGFSVNLTNGAVFNNGAMIATLTLGAVTSVAFRVEQMDAQALSIRFQINGVTYGPYTWPYVGDVWIPMIWFGGSGVTVEMNDGSN